MAFLFNNCRNRDHSRYGSGAFYDLDLRGRQAKMAQGLRPGDVCIVAAYGEGDLVVFGWHTFVHEKRMLDEKGELVRVLFGRPIKSEPFAKSLAARTAPYAHLFDRHGHFKMVSVVKVDNTAAAARPAIEAWAFPRQGA